MDPLKDAKGLEIYWRQPHTFERSFILGSQEFEFASLIFQSAFGSLAIATTAEESWSFKRVGFFNPRVTVRRKDEEIDLGIYRPRWTGSEGTLELGGRSFVWKSVNFWATQFVFTDSQAGELMRFRQGNAESKLTDIFKEQARVEIASHAWEMSELPILISLGWYLIILHQDDSAAVVAATTAAT